MTIRVTDIAQRIREASPKTAFLITGLGDSCAIVANTFGCGLSIDAMGSALSVGIGLAAASTLQVIVVETDGSVLLDLSALATFSEVQDHVSGLHVVILDNGMYHSADSFPRPCLGLDWAMLCNAFNLSSIVVGERHPMTVLGTSLNEWPRVVVCKVEPLNKIVEALPLDGRSRVAAARKYLSEGGFVTYEPSATKN